MTKHDEARRAFLLGAAVGAGAVAGATLVPDALAQTHEPSTTGTGPPHSHAGGPGLGAFFNSEDAATVAAFTERLMPGAPGKPGAHDADVLNYIDLALAGAYADLQYFYRRGLASLDAYCRKTYKEPFRRLSAAQQDEVIAALEPGKAGEFSWPSQGLRRMAPGGIPRRADGIHRGGHAEQRTVHAAAHRRPAGQSGLTGGCEPWQPKKAMLSSSAWARQAVSSQPSSARRA